MDSHNPPTLDNRASGLGHRMAPTRQGPLDLQAVCRNHGGRSKAARGSGACRENAPARQKLSGEQKGQISSSDRFSFPGGHRKQKMQVSSVKFEGIGPFYLRAVEHAKASVLENTIQVTLFARTEEQGDSLVQIETQMTPDTAQELANMLLHAANKTGQ